MKEIIPVPIPKPDINCEYYLDLCLVKASNDVPSIFGFGEFIAALALLLVLYTITDIRYRFRINIAPINIIKFTYVSILIIGVMLLLSDVWFSQGWLIPEAINNKVLWQGSLALYFLSTVLIWLWYAFISPPIFNKRNYKVFANELYRAILKGLDSELPVIANEIGRSAKELIKFSNQYSRFSPNDEEQKAKKVKTPKAPEYAYDILLLIGNRKFCRHVASSSPVTAIVFFDAMSDQEKHNVPLGQFAKNISGEAIMQKDSVLYHEDNGYNSGLIGYQKPFSQSIYGNYQLVESLGNGFGSPLDIDYKISWSWDADQFKVYTNCVLITFENFLESGCWWNHSFALYRSFDTIENSCNDLYKLDKSTDYYPSDIVDRLRVAVDFVKSAIDAINRQSTIPETRMRVKEENNNRDDFYDYIAKLMFEIIVNAALVGSPRDTCWSIHYGKVWSQFFVYNENKGAWKIIRFKLRRLLYDEITRFDKFLNYQSAKVLGFCLNVMGVVPSKNNLNTNYKGLHKAVLQWTKNNYLKIFEENPDVAESCLIGSISFDKENNRLVKTYIKGLDKEEPKEYLLLTK